MLKAISKIRVVKILTGLMAAAAVVLCSVVSAISVADAQAKLACARPSTPPPE